jgi:hypothetical protein
VKTTLGKAEIEAWRNTSIGGVLTKQVEWIEQCDPEALRQSLTENDLKAVEENCSPVLSAADESSKSAPPEIKDLSRDKSVVETAKAVFDGREAAAEVANTEALVTFIRAIGEQVRRSKYWMRRDGCSLLGVTKARTRLT